MTPAFEFVFTITSIIIAGITIIGLLIWGILRYENYSSEQEAMRKTRVDMEKKFAEEMRNLR
jgi:hypothetical protein